MLSALSFALLGTTASSASQFTSRPVVGIYSAPLHHKHPGCEKGCDYVAASYVKWLESAGAQSLPIPYDSTNAEIDAIFPQINGVLFPGGGSSLPDGAKYIASKVLSANDNGTYFPLWGTCLGFEWLLEIVGGKDDLQSGFDSENISMALNLTSVAASSRLLGAISGLQGHRNRTQLESQHLLLDIGNKANPPAMNNHQSGISPKALANNVKLSSFFDVLSTNLDRQGKPFVSTIESKHYPVYGAQWHPEKNHFEWGMSMDGTPYEAINHSPEAIFVSESLADYFVGECRRNPHRRNVDDPAANLFWDYEISNVTAPEFEQSYVIHVKHELSAKAQAQRKIVRVE